MKLIRRLLHRLAQQSRPAQRILALLETGQTEAAFALSSTAADVTAEEWDIIAVAAAGLGAEAAAIVLLALRKGGNRYPLLLAGGQYLLRQGELLRAYTFFTAAHRLLPAEAAPLSAQGEIHFALGNYRAAAQCFLAARQCNSTDATLVAQLCEARRLAHLPVPVLAASNLDEEAHLRQAIDAEPGNFLPFLAYGRILAATTRGLQALPYLEAAHRLSGGTAETARWLAATLTMLNRHEDAFSYAAPALEQAGDDLDLLSLVAESACMTGRNELAVDLYRRLVDALPDADAHLWNNLGSSLSHLERYEEALHALEKARELAPTQPATLINLGYTLNYLGRRAEARGYFDQVLSTESNDFEARLYRSHVLLAEHDFAAGWKDYEFRFVSAAIDPRIIPLPLWQGQALAGKKIVVVAEQGIGDEIMFASCLGELIQQAGHVVIECNRRLINLFARSFPAATIVEWLRSPLPPWLAEHGDADFYVAAGSLPGFFRPNHESFAATPSAFLIHDPAVVEQMRRRMEAFGSGLKVGIAWRGGLALSRRRSRSIDLMNWAPILRTPNCHFISIQYGEHGEEIDTVHKALDIPVHHWPDQLADLDRFAALTAALDLVITVCSAAAHFAGALGKPALILTPHVPEWRYVGQDGRMLWYPSARLLNQPDPGVWSPVIEEAARRLSHGALAPSGVSN